VGNGKNILGGVLCMLKDGIVLGKNNKTIIIDQSKDNILLCGPCRCGKGVNTVIPTLKNFHKSVFAIDWHGEASHFCADDRRKMGQKAFIISPGEDDHDAHPSKFAAFNPLDEIRKECEISDAEVISLALISSITSSEYTPAIRQVAILIQTAFIIICRSKIKDANLFSVLQMIKEFKEKKDANIFNIDDVTRVGFIKQARDKFLQLSDEEINLVLTLVLDSLTFTDDIRYRSAFNKSDFKISDLLDELNPISVFFSLRGWHRQYIPLLRIILHQIFNRVLETSQLSNQTEEPKLLILLDEFPELGKIYENEMLFFYNLKQLPRYGIKTIVIIQDPWQIAKMLGSKNLKGFAECFGQKLFFAPNIGLPIRDFEMLIQINSWNEFDNNSNFISKVKNIIYKRIDHQSKNLKKAFLNNDVNGVLQFLRINDIFYINHGAASLINKIHYFKDAPFNQ
jgi:type IV secretion system protein VirD4